MISPRKTAPRRRRSVSLYRLITPCPILYDWEGLLAVDKPAGVLSHPNPPGGPVSKRPKRSAFEGAYDFDERCFKTPEGPVWLIHRLDQGTSGVLLAARSKEAARESRRLFEEGEIQKSYLVLVISHLKPPRGFWNDCLATRRFKNKVQSCVMPHGPVNARLSYRVRRIYPQTSLSLIDVSLLTGKTHQIRVQCAHRGYPVAGDDVYGDFRLNRRLRREFRIDRLFLHAQAVEMKHPLTRKPIKIAAPLPDKLERVLEALR